MPVAAAPEVGRFPGTSVAAPRPRPSEGLCGGRGSRPWAPILISFSRKLVSDHGPLCRRIGERAARFSGPASHSVSKRPIWLAEAARSMGAYRGPNPRVRVLARGPGSTRPDAGLDPDGDRTQPERPEDIAAVGRDPLCPPDASGEQGTGSHHRRRSASAAQDQFQFPVDAARRPMRS
jgi:hypothetical protein